MPVEVTPANTPARILEAAGATTTSFPFRDDVLTIPLAVEAWPLDAIRANKPGRAVRILLGDQRPDMRTRGDVIALSQAMAAAVGVVPLPEDRPDAPAVFGAIPTLIHIVDNYADDLEADLARFFGVDYRRPPPDGPTMRQVWVMARRMPTVSALSTAANGGVVPWTRADHLTAHLWELQTRKRFPTRPVSHEELASVRAEAESQQAAMDKLGDRQNYYASGQNMRDAGLDLGTRTTPDPPPQRPRPRQSPIEAALAVAEKNARRQPPKLGAGYGRTPGQQPRYDPRGSGWG